MITFDALTLKAFINENRKFFTGARIQKIQQPTRRDIILQLRNEGVVKKLYININPKLYHVCFINKENEGKRHIEIPKNPPMFCMLLRKHLENSQISKVNQPENERIIELYIESYNEINEKIYLCLSIELMGKHSNIILYNSNTNIIIGCAHNVGAEKSREREVAGTLPYTYPPKQDKLDINVYEGSVDYETLSEKFYMFSNYFAKLCRGKPISSLRDYVNLINVIPVVSADYSGYSLFEELLSEAYMQESVNSMIDNYYAYYQEREKFNGLKNTLSSHTNQKLKRVLNSLQKIQTQIQQETNSDNYRLWGDLLMANLYLSKDYSDEVELFDWENNKNIIIKLEPNKTLKENANKFYKLYNKSKTSKLKLSELCVELEQTKLYLEQILYSLNSAEKYEDLLEIASELKSDIGQKKEKIKAVVPQKIVKDNFVIYIGKNNLQNDYIISKLAKEDDLWFHTKDCAGSHVLLKGENPTNEIILFCAKLAKKHSSGAESSKIGVIYTKRKYLKKPPKANLGYVTYRNEKEIIIDY